MKEEVRKNRLIEIVTNLLEVDESCIYSSYAIDCAMNVASRDNTYCIVLRNAMNSCGVGHMMRHREYLHLATQDAVLSSRKALYMAKDTIWC